MYYLFTFQHIQHTRLETELTVLTVLNFKLKKHLCISIFDHYLKKANAG